MTVLRTGAPVRLCSWQAGIVNYSKYKNNQAFKKLFLWANHFHEHNCHDPRPLCSYPFSSEAHVIVVASGAWGARSLALAAVARRSSL